MSDERIDPKVTKRPSPEVVAAEKSIASYIETHPNAAPGALAEVAIRAADRARGLKEERRRCTCDGGRVESGPSGATYSMPHERCGATGWVQRLVSDWRPVERRDA